MTDELTAVDRAALARALALVRASKDPGRRAQIEGKLREDGWYEAASFAAYSSQIDALRLKPWQDPPCYGHLGDDAEARSCSGGSKRPGCRSSSRIRSAH
jgi:hypothetical protein